MRNDWTHAVIQQWRSEGIEINQSATPETISNAELILGFTFPDDFKELYLQVNGFANWDWRPNMFSIWPIERILKEYGEESNKNHVGFSDFLINSHQIGFIKGREGVFVLYGEYPDKIADTFLEAIHLINSDSDKIY